MIRAHIRFSPAILRRLGEELNPHIDQGILELVKNSYDADALTCTVALVDVDKPGGAVIVEDDGVGMSVREIENGWLMLGASEKDSFGKSRLGRRRVGNKGLGRLAALRAGSRATLRTFPEIEAGHGFEIAIDWAKFDTVSSVEEVALEIVEIPGGERKGTRISVEGLRSRLARAEVRRLARELILLTDPFGNPTGFRPILVAPEFVDLEKLVANKYFEEAEYHLIAQLDENGRASAEVVDYHGARLFDATHTDIVQQQTRERYDAPRLTFELWIFILDERTFTTRSSTLSDVKKWLTEFGGVHVYHRGIRVLPYGNPGNDWLGLNLRRVQTPELRPSTNTSIGRFALDDTDGRLEQKTDRGGFVEDAAFTEMRAFAMDTLEWLARRRLELREQRRSEVRATVSKSEKTARESLTAAVAAVPPSARKHVETALSAYERASERRTRALLDEVQLYRTLGTAGITASVFAHESNKALINVSRHVRSVERRLKSEVKVALSRAFEDDFRLILNTATTLRTFGNVTLGLLEHEKRRRKRVDVHVVLRGVVKLFRPHLERRCVRVDLDLATGPAHVFGSEAALESVFINFLTNSLEALKKTASDDRLVRFVSEIDPVGLHIRVVDNGPGIEGLSLRDIWLPGQTTTAEGAGLGLTITRDAIADLGGSVNAVAHGELGGAEFQMVLPLLKAHR